MRDPIDYMTFLPEFEDESTVESTFPIRIGTDPETGSKKLYLEQDLYDTLSAAWWFFDTDAITISVVGGVGGMAIIELIKQHIPEVIASGNISMFEWRVKCMLLMMLILQRAVSIGKFTFEDVGFGESFGNVFGGGTITREQ